MKSWVLSILIFITLVGGILTIAAKVRTPQKDPTGTVDGSITPSAIPDHVAYEMFFASVVPNPAHGITEGAVSAKLAQIGLSETDGSALRALASDFLQRRADLDKQVTAMKDENLLAESPSTLGRLKDIQSQKEVVIDEMRGLLAQRLSGPGAAKVNQYVHEYVKRRIKIVPPSHHK
ncbi:MAG: hypothetical protein ACREAB_07410 [Blastocatellia bacterium]